MIKHSDIYIAKLTYRYFQWLSKTNKNINFSNIALKNPSQNSCKGNGVSSVHSIATQAGRPRFFTCPFNTRYSIYERYYCRRARVFMSQDL